MEKQNSTSKGNSTAPQPEANNTEKSNDLLGMMMKNAEMLLLIPMVAYRAEVLVGKAEKWLSKVPGIEIDFSTQRKNAANVIDGIRAVGGFAVGLRNVMRAVEDHRDGKADGMEDFIRGTRAISFGGVAVKAIRDLYVRNFVQKPDSEIEDPSTQHSNGQQIQ